MAATRYSGIRARDTDRADVCGLLDAAQADGQLTDAEHAARTATAMQAKSFGELDAIVGDLQITDELSNSRVVRVDRRRPRRWLAPVAIVSAAAVVGAMVGGISRCGVDLPGSSEHVPLLTSGPGLAYFIDEYRAEFGDTLIDEVTFFPEYVHVDRKAADNPDKTADYYYNGDFRTSTTSARKSDVRTFDLATIDLRTIARLLAGAPQTTKVGDGVIGHVTVSNNSTGHGEPGPVVTIYVGNKTGGSGHFIVTLSGEPLQIFPATR
jgi:hypothetical protein